MNTLLHSSFVLGVLFLPAAAFAQDKATSDDKIVSVDLGGNVKLKMIRIPKGSFLMGSKKADDPKAANDEQPQHDVELTRDFYLGETEVTVGQFKQFVADTRYETEAEKPGADDIWKSPGFEKEVQTDDHPVVLVTYNDAVKFCEWMSKKTGHKYGLPTEAQWEYACRAGSKTIYSFGDDAKQLGDFAWFKANTKETGTRAVRQKKPNGFGLYDMHGNVWEWCADSYNSKAYTNAKRIDPLVTEGSDRVLRGGGWIGVAFVCRSAFRKSYFPSDRSSYVGFRVSRVP